MQSEFTIFNLRVNGKAWTGSTRLLQRRRSSRLIHWRGTSCFRCYGTRKGPHLNIARRKVKQWIVRATVSFKPTNWNRLPAQSE